MTAITLLDGSIGQELVHRSGNRATPLWSTSVMMDAPELVGAVHADYFNAGATVATANTYAIHTSRLERVGLEDQHGILMDAALTQAETARAAHGSGRIAGSLGPLLASYRPDLQPAVDMAAERYGIIAGMMAGRVDLLLAETVSSLQEAEGVLAGTADAQEPLWIAFSVDDDDGTRLRSGEAVTEILPLVATHKPQAVLLNCSTPEAISAGLPALAETGLPYGAYANGFTKISDGFKAEFPTVDALEQRRDLTPERYADFALSWVEQGATIVGGCCEVSPAHITKIAARLKAAGHTIV